MEAETSWTTMLHRGKLSSVLHLHVIYTCAVTHPFTPVMWGARTYTAFGTRTITAMFVDADLFHHFSLRQIDPLPFSYCGIGLFDAILHGPQRIVYPITSFCEAVSDVQHPLVAYCGVCSGRDYYINKYLVEVYSVNIYIFDRKVLSPPRK